MMLPKLSFKESSEHKSESHGGKNRNFRFCCSLFCDKPTDDLHVHIILIVLIYLIMHDNNDNFRLSLPLLLGFPKTDTEGENLLNCVRKHHRLKS